MYTSISCIFSSSYSSLKCFLEIERNSFCLYSIAIIGIDRYIRMKHYESFKAFWTARVVSTLICIQVFLAFFQAAMVALSFFRNRK